MTETCELCGRALARKMIVPTWFPYEILCERRKCRLAVKDAIEAIEQSREEHAAVIGGIAQRHEAQYASIGYRTDSMCQIQFDDPGWFPNELVKENV